VVFLGWSPIRRSGRRNCCTRGRGDCPTLGRALESKAQIGSGASPLPRPRVGAWPAPSGRGGPPGHPGPARRERPWMARLVAPPPYRLLAWARQSRPGLEVPAYRPLWGGSLRRNWRGAPSWWRTRFEMRELPVRRFASKAAWETPRRSRSKWSQINCAAVERLHAQGRLVYRLHECQESRDPRAPAGEVHRYA
jgi:hypothetical protein